MRSAAPLRPVPGAEPLPGYRLEKFLGRGGFGEVWRAIGPGGFPVALKFLPADEAAAERELKALEMLQWVRDAHLLSLFGVSEIPGWHVLAMELADRTLDDRLIECTKSGQAGIPREELLSFFHDAAKAIDYLNEPRHFVIDGKTPSSLHHGDIKPQNLLIVGTGCKVGDFGLLRCLSEGASRRTANMTPTYAPPEVFDGKPTRNSDQYSLAVTWCYLRGGRPPFEGPAVQLMGAHLMSAPDLTMLPPDERPAVLRALAKKPDERWPTCAAFVEALRSAVLLPPQPSPRSGRSGGREKENRAERAKELPTAFTEASHRETVTPPPVTPPAKAAKLRDNGRTMSISEGADANRKRAASQKRDELTFWERPLRWVPLVLLPALVAASVIVASIARRSPTTPGTSPEVVNVPQPKKNDLIVKKAEPEPKNVEPVKKTEPEPVKKAEVPAKFEPLPKKNEPPKPRQPGDEIEVEIVPGVKMTFCWIPPGEAQLGSPRAEQIAVLNPLKRASVADEDETTRGIFKTKGFWMGKYEVTQAQWVAVMGGSNPSRFVPTDAEIKKAGIRDTGRFPVERVSWNDCQDFLKKLRVPPLFGKFDLPHEDQWEYACRGDKGNKQAYYFGRALNGTQANCDGSFPFGTTTKGPNLQRTAEVGSYEKTSPHPWGLCDMHGNIWEWCSNNYDDNQTVRVVRGGSWFYGSRYCRSAVREKFDPGVHDYSIGCRLVALPQD